MKPVRDADPNREPGKTASLLGTAAILVTIVLYAANFVACRYSLHNGLSAFDLVALRYSVAGLLLLPYFCRLGLKDLGGVGWQRAIVLACLAGSPYMFLFFTGLRFAPASHGAVLNPGVVPSVVFLSMVWLGLQTFSLAMLMSLALIVVGLILVTGSSFSAQGGVLFGDILLFTTGVSWGLFTLLARLWELKPMQSAATVSVISVVYLPVYFVCFYDGFASASLTHIAAQAVFQGAINSVATLCLVTYAIRTLGAQLTSLFSPLVPVLTTVLAILLLGEIPTATQSVGVLIVVIGLSTAAVLNYRASTTSLARGPQRQLGRDERFTSSRCRTAASRQPTQPINPTSHPAPPDLRDDR